jgi:hypothetical protein
MVVCLYFQDSSTKTLGGGSVVDLERFRGMGEYKIFGSGQRNSASNFMSVASRR